MAKRSTDTSFEKAREQLSLTESVGDTAIMTLTQRIPELPEPKENIKKRVASVCEGPLGKVGRNKEKRDEYRYRMAKERK